MRPRAISGGRPRAVENGAPPAGLLAPLAEIAAMVSFRPFEDPVVLRVPRPCKAARYACRATTTPARCWPPRPVPSAMRTPLGGDVAWPLRQREARLHAAARCRAVCRAREPALLDVVAGQLAACCVTTRELNRPTAGGVG